MRYAQLCRVCLSVLLPIALQYKIFDTSYLLGQEPSTSSSNEESEEDKKERITAERFLELLKKKPRLGTALDKVYGYHVSRGSLDSLTATLEAQAENVIKTGYRITWPENMKIGQAE